MAASTSCDLSSEYTKSHLEKLNQLHVVEAYECVIVQLIRPSLLLLEMENLFGVQKRQEITSLEQRDGAISAACLFMRTLIEEKKQGWYQTFTAALKRKEYTYIAKFLENQDTEMEQSIYRTVVQKCLHRLSLTDPGPLLPHLRSHGCIISEEVDLILRTAERNVVMANFILIDVVVSHNEKWFDCFIDTLTKEGYKNIASQIREDLDAECEDNLNRILKKPIPETTTEVDNNASYVSNSELCEDGDVDLNEKSDDTSEDVNSDEIVLRDYQIPLARDAMLGKNVIIIAPTGSGKTYVAMAIVKNHFTTSECEEKPKVLFIVPTVPLVDQQFNRFKSRFSDKSVMKLSGDDAHFEITLKDIFEKNDIVVLTPEILINALKKEKVRKMEKFTMIILDECHHTSKNNPYAMMMKHYLIEKHNSAAHMPQILGLTASVGIAKSSTEKKAKEHIIKMCAHLDVEEISMMEGDIPSSNILEDAKEVSGVSQPGVSRSAIPQ